MSTDPLTPRDAPDAGQTVPDGDPNAGAHAADTSNPLNTPNTPTDHDVDTGEDAQAVPDLDAAILQPSSQQRAVEGILGRIPAGAAVYASDGTEVAVVESIQPGHLIVRAGFPGRPVDLPADVVGEVSADGQRVQVKVPAAEIERLAGTAEPGYVHLQAQQQDALDEERTEGERGSGAGPAR